ncbi:hypothetical protein [Methylobacterium sp. J-070]|uniref:hypothetical protein n=1 Tax=Methylobacterium sp. J-070 TaxID=2836650 RepID=UPI001FB9EBD0|nr:hypothetical protein [Methylobacterium sp. J-070]MCJ2052833.1 hypothetical protein [Methylobacterium sp. J-070]
MALLYLGISTTAEPDREVSPMGNGRKVLSSDHARALIKQAIGMIFGDTKVEAEATTEIATIEARHTTDKPTRPRRPART